MSWRRKTKQCHLKDLYKNAVDTIFQHNIKEYELVF